MLVAMFESKRKVKVEVKVGVHYKMGVDVGNMQDISLLN